MFRLKNDDNCLHISGEKFSFGGKPIKEKPKDEKMLLQGNITNPNSIYIKGQIKFAGYKNIELHCYVDTGASLCIASKHVIPREHWENAPRPITVKIADGSTVQITKVCRNLNMKIAGEIFHIPTVYQQETGMDFIIGNNFCQLYEPFVQYTDRIIFTLDGQPIVIGKIRKALSNAKPGFLDSMKKTSKLKKPEPINVSPQKITLFKGGKMRKKNKN